MNSDSLTPEEIAIIDRLSPEAIRLFLKKSDTGLHIENLDVAQLRQALFNTPVDIVRRSLQLTSTLEAESICRHQLEELKEQVHRKLTNLKHEEHAIVGGHKMLMGIISAAGMIGGLIGWNGYMKLDEAVTKAQQLSLNTEQDRKTVAQLNHGVSSTLLALVKAHAITVDQGIRQAIENSTTPTFTLSKDALELVQQELRYTEELIRILMEQKSLFQPHSLTSTDPDHIHEDLALQVRRLEIIKRFQEGLALLTEEDTQGAALLRTENVWQQIHDRFDDSRKTSTENDELLNRMCAYTHNVLGNLHFAKWDEGTRSNIDELLLADREYANALKIMPTFMRSMSNRGVVQLILATFDDSDPRQREQHFISAEKAFTDSIKFERIPSRRNSFTLNLASLRLWQSRSSMHSPDVARSRAKDALKLAESVSEVSPSEQRTLALVQAKLQLHLVDPTSSSVTEVRKDIESLLRSLRGQVPDLAKYGLENHKEIQFINDAITNQVLTKEEVFEWLGLEK